MSIISILSNDSAGESVSKPPEKIGELFNFEAKLNDALNEFNTNLEKNSVNLSPECVIELSDESNSVKSCG